MSMKIDGSTHREKFLDNFPLQETEVDRLIALYNALCEASENDESPTGSLSQLRRQVQAQKITETEADENDQKWLSALELVEEAILPDALNSLKEASNSVAPLMPYDVEDDMTSPICRAWYFLEAVVSLLGRRGNRFLINFVYDRAMKLPTIKSNGGGEGADPKALMQSVYRYLVAALYLKDSASDNDSFKKRDDLPLEPPEAWILSLVQSAGSSISISRPAWTAFVNDVMPEALRGLSTFYHHALFPPGQPYGPTSPKPFSLPQPDQENSFWGLNSNLLLPLSLGCISPVLGGAWYRVYSSNWDGSSFLSFQKALLSYKGPTVMMIRRKGSEGVFGYYTDCPWRESNDWFGGEGHDSFLFKLDTSLGVCWPTWEANGHYMYLNSSPLHGMQQTQTTTLRGLAIGGISIDTPRVHLTASFENCKAASTDTTYGSGALLDDPDASPFFDVDAIEVWAVNVTKAEFLKNQASGQEHIARKEEARQRAAQVDRAQFLHDFESGAYVNNLYAHREEARGRHDFVASSNGRGYFLEGKQPSKRALFGEENSGAGDKDETK